MNWDRFEWSTLRFQTVQQFIDVQFRLLPVTSNSYKRSKVIAIILLGNRPQLTNLLSAPNTVSQLLPSLFLKLRTDIATTTSSSQSPRFNTRVANDLPLNPVVTCRFKTVFLLPLRVSFLLFLIGIQGEFVPQSARYRSSMPLLRHLFSHFNSRHFNLLRALVTATNIWGSRVPFTACARFRIHHY